MKIKSGERVEKSKSKNNSKILLYKLSYLRTNDEVCFRFTLVFTWIHVGSRRRFPGDSGERAGGADDQFSGCTTWT